MDGIEARVGAFKKKVNSHETKFSDIESSRADFMGNTGNRLDKLEERQ